MAERASLEREAVARLGAVEAERDDLRRKYGDAADRNELMQRWEQATKRAVSAEQQRDTLIEAIRRFLDTQGRSLPVESGAYEEANAIRGLRQALKDIGAVEGSEDG